MLFIGGPKDGTFHAVEGSWFKCIVYQQLAPGVPLENATFKIIMYNRVFLRGEYPVMAVEGLTADGIMEMLTKSDKAVRLLLEAYVKD